MAAGQQQGNSPQRNPYSPALPEPQVLEQFEGVNTSTTRTGVPDQQVYWMDGFMPIGPRQARTMYGAGSAIYTASGGLTIVLYGFYNIGSTAYCAVFLSDGSAVQVNVATKAVTTIFPASMLINVAITSVGLTQYGQQYLLISSSQINGYWIWDGMLLYDAGSLAPTVTLTNVGAGYTTAPVVTITGGSGYGATFVASIANGEVTTVQITNPGQGYLAGDTPSLVITGGTSSGTGGTVTAALSHAVGGSLASITLGYTLGYIGNNYYYYYLSSVTIVNAGTGYDALTQVTAPLNSVGPSQYPAVLSPIIANGSISSVQIISDGSYVGPGPNHATVVDSGFYYVSSTSIVAAGAGYSPTAEITAIGGGATVVQEAVLSLSLTGGSITSIILQSGGIYGSNISPTLSITDSSIAAVASVTLMPFGISGNAVETYSGHVWVADGPIVYYTAPGSPSDFATSDGGGNFTSNSSVLRSGYTQLLSTNGFLYLIGDSSMDYISSVQTSGSPITTSYTLQNADPEVGTPYPASVITLGPDIVLANSFGVHVSRGAALEKVSEAMDGVYASVANFGGLQLASAKATLFNKRVFMLLQQIVNPVSGATVNELLLWDGKKKWWASTQDFGPLTFIAAQEINSVLTAYGTDGTVIQPMFAQPSTGFAKTIQSRLWDAPGGYQFIKATGRFWSVWNYNTANSPNILVGIDSVGTSTNLTFTNSASYTITGPSGAGYFVTPPEAIGQQGVFTGITLTTSEGDVSLVSAMIQNDPKISYRG